MVSAADRRCALTGRTRLAEMHGDVPGATWPPLFSTRIAPLAAFVEQLELSQFLSPEQIAAGQARQLAAITGHSALNSPGFRARIEAAGLTAADLVTHEGLAALPPLTRQQIQTGASALLCASVPSGHAPLQTNGTSGSTGEPVSIERTSVNRLHWQAMTLRYHLWAEPDFHGRLSAIRANLKRVGFADSWDRPVSVFFDTGPSYRIDIKTDLAAQLDELVAFAPTSLVVYPSNLAALLDEMDARGIDLPSLKRVRTLGETVPPGLRERLAQRTGATLFDCYSSEEVGYIALQCPETDLYHVMAETVIVEIVDESGAACREGEAGRVLVTDLHNHAMPMIRYAIGDYAEAGPTCPCGRGLPTLRRILGRERNIIVNPDGSRHWPLTGFARFRDIAPIGQYQMRQHAPDRLEMRLVTERPLAAAEEEALIAHVRKVAGHPFAIELVYFEGQLPKGPNGKFEEFLRLF